MNRTARNLLFITAAVISVAVSLLLKPVSHSNSVQDNRVKLYNNSVYPQELSLVRTGDLVTRLGSDITSEMIRQLNDSDKSFSHCGIASLENDTLFVYHALGGEFNPDQKLKREPLYSFGHPLENKAIGIFHPALNNLQRARLLSIVTSLYASGTPFDMAFDYKTEDRLYCAEFVAKSYSRCTGDSSWIRFSTRGDFRFVSVENLIHNNLVKEIKRWNY